MDRTPVHIYTGNIQSGGCVSIGNQITNYSKSVEWKDLQKEKQKIEDRLNNAKANTTKYPQDDSFKKDVLQYQQELEECNDRIKQFQHEILQLAEKFIQIEIDTERKEKAYKAFLDGRYSDARVILETEESIQENYDLLKERTSLKHLQEENEKKLKYKAEENILLAHLHTINYSLGNERIPKVQEYFKLAIEQHDIPDYRLDYALFLSQNKKFSEAEKIYKETLKKCRELASKNNNKHLMYCLGDFARFLRYYPHKWNNAEKYYQEAISIYETLDEPTTEDSRQFIFLLKGLADILDYCARYTESEKYYKKCLKGIEQNFIDDPVSIAIIYHDYAIMLAKIPSKFADCKSFYHKALLIRRKLMVQNPRRLEALEHLMLSFKSLGKLLSDYPQYYGKAKKYYQEALRLLKRLIEKDSNRYDYLKPEIYSNFAMLLNNIWEINKDQVDVQEIQDYYEKAIYSSRNQIILNPGTNDERVLALALHNYGTLKFQLGIKDKAKTLYDESLSILEKILKNLDEENSFDIQDDIAMVKTSLANLYIKAIFPEHFKAAYLYQQALDIRINLFEKQPGIYLRNFRYCLKCIKQFLQTYGKPCENLEKKYYKAILLSRINL